MRLLLAMLFSFSLMSSSQAWSRSVYLNGSDISSARGQELKNVTLHINERGDIFIVAPNYQVNEEDSFVPLSKYVQGMNLPRHKNPQALSKHVKVPRKFGEPLKKAGDPPPHAEAPGSQGAGSVSGAPGSGTGQGGGSSGLPKAGQTP